MTRNINYFERVINVTQLEREIISAGKQDEVGGLAGNIGLNNAYRKYAKFLYLRLNDADVSGRKVRLELLDPGSLKQLFVAEVKYDPVWSGVNDQNTFNPLFNELIKYIERNSKTFKRK